QMVAAGPKTEVACPAVRRAAAMSHRTLRYALPTHRLANESEHLVRKRVGIGICNRITEEPAQSHRRSKAGTERPHGIQESPLFVRAAHVYAMKWPVAFLHGGPQPRNDTEPQQQRHHIARQRIAACAEV